MGFYTKCFSSMYFFDFPQIYYVLRLDNSIYFVCYVTYLTCAYFEIGNLKYKLLATALASYKYNTKVNVFFCEKKFYIHINVPLESLYQFKKSASKSGD
jgi:hypothetical protein